MLASHKSTRGNHTNAHWYQVNTKMYVKFAVVGQLYGKYIIQDLDSSKSWHSGIISVFYTQNSVSILIKRHIHPTYSEYN